MSRLLYKDEISINGHIVSNNGKIVVIELATGGTMTLEKDDIKLVPDVEKPKRKKKAEVRKKALKLRIT
ncbi:hypothetical protein [Robertmurraya korlensis]|uniref:hypothetical protein n=1 Tax=Robertmurraya korlensis TaxID=519977 RepID=UPI0008247743|nr:hypothetical protein [Robertmurraya korlensis]